MSNYFKTDLEKELAKYSGFDCEVCKAPLSINVYQYSSKTFGRLLCFSDQQVLKNQAPHTKEEDKIQAEEDYYTQD